jgi:hypothetical protein
MSMMLTWPCIDDLHLHIPQPVLAKKLKETVPSLKSRAQHIEAFMARQAQSRLWQLHPGHRMFT